MTLLKLKTKLLTIVLILLTSLGVFSQTKIVGTILNGENKPIPFASILLRLEKNQSIVTYAYANDEGSYTLKLDKTGNFIISFSSLAYKTKDLFISILSETKLLEKNVILENKIQELNEVIIAVRKPIVVKKDTIIYDAQSFLQGNEQVIEDLLKKIPGLTVSSDGTIKIGNQEVEKVMVEGEDMFEKGYKILTKNMPVYPIDKVEVLNNYANNKHLKGIEGSNKVALNLTLKENFKRKWFGNMELGYGAFAKNRYDIQTNLMNFGKKDKYYFLANANTISKDATGEISHLIYSNKTGDAADVGDNQNLSTILGINTELPTLNEKLIDFNDDKMLSLNSIFTISPKIKLKLLGFINSTQNDFYKNNFHTYFIEQTNFSNSEIFQIRNKTLAAVAKVNLIYDISKKATFEYKGTINHGSDKSKSDLNFNGTFINEKLNNINELNDHKLVYTTSFKDKKAFIISGRYLNQSLPQNYDVNQFIYQNLFQSDANNLMQITENKFSFFALDAHLLDRKNNGNLLELWIGNQHRIDHVNSRFGIYKDENLLNEPMLYQNQLKYAVNDLYSKNRYVLKLNKISLVTQLDIHQLFNSKNSMEDLSFERPFFINPKIGINWALNDKNKIVSLYSKNISNALALDIYQGYIQTSFRNFSKGMDQFNQLSSSTYFFKHSFSSADSRFFINNNVLLTENGDYFSNNSILTPNYIQSSKILIKGQNILNLSSDIEYYLKNILTNVKLSFGASRSDYKNTINGSELRPILSKNLIYAIELRSGFNGIFNYNFGTKWNNTKLKVLTTNSYTNNMMFLDISLVFSNKFNLQVQTERYFFDNIGSDMNRYYFLNSKVQYTLKENKLSFSLFGNNLLNTKTFTNYSISDTNILNTEYRLVPRYFFLKAEFRF